MFVIEQVRRFAGDGNQVGGRPERAGTQDFGDRADGFGAVDLHGLALGV